MRERERERESGIESGRAREERAGLRGEEREIA